MAALVGLSACAAGPNYHAPESASLGVPAGYYGSGTAQQADQNDARLATWW